MDSSDASDHVVVIRRLREAWSEMQKFGNGHDGECDNNDCCVKCGSRLNGCSLHIAKVNERMDAMQKAIDDVVAACG